MRPAILALAVLLSGTAHPALAHRTAAQPARVALALHDNTRVRSSPSLHGRVIANLVMQTQVEIRAQRRNWYHIRLWDSVAGWIKKSDVTFRAPWHVTSTYHAPSPVTRIHATRPLAVRSPAVAQSGTDLRSTPRGAIRGWLAAGSRLNISAWQQDAAGTIWYRDGTSWVQGEGISFTTANPRTAQVHGRPVAARVAGKGMWLTLGSVTQNNPATLVRAARRNGITHLYVEAAISPLGFHGRNSVGPLIEQAHRAHVAVLAWVYPYLDDVANDVALTRQVAAYRSPHGESFDGIAADLERNMTLPRIRAYSQLVRAYVGPHYLLVGVTYPPQSIPTYPFAEVALRYNVLAPMDYWHQTRSANGLDYGHMAYSWAYGYRYAMDSITRIRATAGPVIVEPIGQAFDDFGRYEMGPDAPTADELRGFFAACRAAGSPGLSFFQWLTVTDNEWNVIHDTKY